MVYLIIIKKVENGFLAFKKLRNTHGSPDSFVKATEAKYLKIS